MFYIMGNDSIEISFYYKETLIVFSSNILLYMIQYLVVFYFGKGASIGIGIIGSLISALMLTGLGDGNMASDTLGIFNEIIFLLYIV